MMNEQEIRRRLNAIDCTDRRTHAVQIEQLRRIEPQVSVELVRDCTGWDNDYICHLYTFDVPQNSYIFLQKERVFPIYPTLQHCTIFEDLLNRGLIEATPTMQGAQIIVYCKNNGNQEVHIHSGKVQGECVLSKWGRGHIWKHKPQHVASVFEDNGVLRMRFFKHPDSKRTLEYLEQKARR